jgi:hypothetical protein
MDYFEIVMTPKVSQEQRIARYTVSFFCITGKMMVVVADSCMFGDFLRTGKPTFPVGQSTSFEMMVNLIVINQLPEIRGAALAFN